MKLYNLNCFLFNRNHFNINYLIDRNRLKRKDSKIPSAIFGDFHDFRGKNPTNYSKSPNNSEDLNINNLKKTKSTNDKSTTFNSYSNKDSKQTKSISNGKVYRRYSSFSPQICNNLANNQNSAKPRKGVSTDNGNFGMNIFSNNIYKNYNLTEKNKVNAKKCGEFGNYNLTNKLSKKTNIDTNLRKRGKQNENSSKSILYSKNKNISLKLNLSNDDEYNNFGYCSFSRKIGMMNTISPPSKKLRHYYNEQEKLKNSINLSLIYHQSENIPHKVENKRSNKEMSSSHVGLNRNFVNKLFHDHSNSFDSYSYNEKNSGVIIKENSLINVSNNNSIINVNNNSSNRANNNLNTGAFLINPIKKNSGGEDWNYRKSSFLIKETQLNTIREDNEIAIKFSKINNSYNEIIDNYSDINDENNEKKITINSFDIDRNIDTFSQSSKMNNYNRINNLDNKNFTKNDLMNLETDSIKINNICVNNIPNMKNIIYNKDHFRERIKDVIKEDKSDSYCDSSDSSDDNSQSQKEKVSGLKEISNKKLINEETKETTKINPKDSDDSKENIIKRINSIVSERKRIEKENSMEELRFKKLNSLQDKTYVINNTINSKEITGSKFMNILNDDENLDIFFSKRNIDKSNNNLIKINDDIISNNIDSNSICESIKEFDSQIYNNKKNSVSLCFDVKDKHIQLNEVNYTDLIDQNIHELKEKNFNKSNKIINYIGFEKYENYNRNDKSKFDKKDELDIENLIIINSSGDESDQQIDR